MKYKKAKILTIAINTPDDKEKVNKTMNEGIENGWQPINISISNKAEMTEKVYILMGKVEDE